MQNEKKFIPGARAVWAGLLITQAIATLHVYFSDVRLHAQIRLILDAGYLAVPNQNILPQLLSLRPAFWGGLFFTLTIGCFLSLVSFAAAWLYGRVFHHGRWAIGVAAGLWLALLWGVNAKGFALFESAYIAFVMPCVFWIAVKSIKQTDQGRRLVPMLLHCVPIILLAMLWTFQTDQRMFTDFRDTMLLSNRPGLAITDFYYTYTLYPAQVFKSLDQKPLKAVFFDNINDAAPAGRLKSRLLSHDYLPIQRKEGADLVVSMAKDRLLFAHKNRRVLEVALNAFLNEPRKSLKAYSKLTDPDIFFRRLTFVSLLVGLPVCLYLFLYSGVRFVLLRFSGLKAASILSVALCFIAGLSLLIPFQLARRADIGKRDIPRLLISENSRDRANALKTIYDKNLEIADYPAYRKMIHASSIPERYWLAMTLRNSAGRETFGDLMEMAQDPNLIVACKAFYALGHRGNPAAIPFLLEKLNDSDHWYAQVYAYGALKELGWKQTGSG